MRSKKSFKRPKYTRPGALNFLDVAHFLGGTSLRILFGLPRLSEDAQVCRRAGLSDGMHRGVE